MARPGDLGAAGAKALWWTEERMAGSERRWGSDLQNQEEQKMELGPLLAWAERVLNAVVWEVGLRGTGLGQGGATCIVPDRMTTGNSCCPVVLHLRWEVTESPCDPGILCPDFCRWGSWELTS